MPLENCASNPYTPGNINSDPGSSNPPYYGSSGSLILIPERANLVLSSAAPTVAIAEASKQPAAAQLVLSATAPTVAISTNIAISPTAAQLVLSSAAPTLGPLDGLSDLTGAWSMSRRLLSAYAGSLYTDTAGEVSTLFDQSGNSRDLTAGAGVRPAVSTAGPNSRASSSFDGVDNRLNSAAAISAFIANSAGYIICSVVIDAISTNDATIFNNDPVWIDSGNFCGVYAKSAPTIQAYNFDGSAGGDATSAIAITTGSALVIEWRHDGGNIMCRVNKGTWQSTASGNTQTMTGTLQIAADNSGGTQNWIDMHLLEMAAFNVVPSEATRDEVADNMMRWAGAS